MYCINVVLKQRHILESFVLSSVLYTIMTQSYMTGQKFFLSVVHLNSPENQAINKISLKTVSELRRATA